MCGFVSLYTSVYIVHRVFDHLKDSPEWSNQLLFLFICSYYSHGDITMYYMLTKHNLNCEKFFCLLNLMNMLHTLGIGLLFSSVLPCQ